MLTTKGLLAGTEGKNRQGEFHHARLTGSLTLSECEECNFALSCDRHAVARLCGVCGQMANHPKFRRHVHQMSEGVCFHFSHYTAAVHLYRNFADSQFCSYFLV